MSQSAKDRLNQAISAPRRRRAKAVADEALREAGQILKRAGFDDPTLVLRWTDIVGETVARMAEPLKLQAGREGAVLTLKCRPGAAVLLQHETRTLIERVNAYLGGAAIARLKLIERPIAEFDDLPDHPAKASRGGSPAPAGLADALALLAQRRKG